MKTVFKDGCRVLGRHGPHEDGQEEDFKGAFGDEGPSNSVCARIDGLID